jgi:hypothetical protein
VPAQTPRSDIEEGTFQMTITVRNPFSYPVVAKIPPDGAYILGYGYDVVDVADTVRGASVRFFVEAPETTRFRAGQTKSFLVDFQIGPDDVFRQSLAAGTYRFGGSFGGAPAVNAPVLTIGP